MQSDPRDMLCASKCVCVFMLIECCLLFHLALMMDLCVFSYMHAFVLSSYVSERVLARADKCMFAEWMMFVVPFSPDYYILTQKLDWSTKKQTDPLDILCASKCVCVFMLNECCLLFHLARWWIFVRFHTYMPSCTHHIWESVCLPECLGLCLLNECCSLFHLDLMMCFHTCMPSCTHQTWASVCLYERACVFLLSECCLLLHL